MDQLTELEADALNELFNISLGGAAKLLSEMISNEILLTVPGLKLITFDDAIKMDNLIDRDVCSIKQNFKGGLGNGSAFILFHKTSSLEIVRMMMKDYVETNEVSHFEKDALSEIGNIILNSILSTLAKMAQKKIETFLPEFNVGKYQEMIHQDYQSDENTLLLAFINYHVKGRDIQGYIFFVLEFKSIKELSQVLISEL
ncbi:chemotaxis protein CheC [Leptospira ryugenii]|uniref:Chemotaxis protein CheC n=1 Tax=Leptospira ryugenii TaxID=1917863 RepID=A0A2P2E3Q2_9LEPT|nr:chemotaxis protein CheC [Leptospira ryugenii]GBF51501.1 chemotaxis protein CheC [Leptospira ryugenii]